MSQHRKVYRFRMRPTMAQEQSLNRLAGARRFIWNWGLARRREYYKATGKTLSYAKLNKELTDLKRQPGMEWLREADAQSLQEALRDLDRAFANFFTKRARYPKFKSRKRDKARFRIPQRVKVTDSKVYVPKVGHVRIRQSQPIEGPTKSATFRRSADGKWYISLVAEFEIPDVILPAPNPAKIIGIDLGLIDFATLSEDDAKPIPTPRFYRKAQRDLRKAQRTFSRRQKGSRRRAKAKLWVAKIHQKIANQRGDFLHKLTTNLINDHDAVCIEDLNLKGLARTKRLAKSFRDASFGEFKRQLIYKAEWNRRHLIMVNRFFPSSKMCNRCGALNETLTLKDREWDCDCGAHHKRDFNAACNIRDEGLCILAAGHAERKNAQGQSVRPATAGRTG
jgi:putative transposase